MRQRLVSLLLSGTLAVPLGRRAPDGRRDGAGLVRGPIGRFGGEQRRP